MNLLIISFFRTDFLIFFYCYDYVRTSGRSLKRTYYIIIIIIFYPPAAATVPICTYNIYIHIIYNIHCSRESCATFGIQTTVNSDRIYTNTRTRFGDKNRRHGWTRVSYSMYHSGWPPVWGGVRGRWNFLRNEKRRIHPRGQNSMHIII